MDDYKQLLRDRPELLEALEGGTPVHSPEFSEDWLSLRFAAKYGDTLRYVAEWGQWLEWTGMFWCRESTLKVFDFARSICRQTAATTENQTTKKKLCDGSTVTAVERLARSDRQLSATSDQWNADTLQINCLSGTIDLQTAKPLSHNAVNYHTKIAGTSFSQKRPEMWLDFLERVTAGDKDLQAYLRRVAGYCLSGSTQEHALFFLYGNGANGKSVFTSTLSGVMGDYAKATPVETFTEHFGGEQHPCAVAALQGVRLAVTQETERNSRWAESKLKQMTGGDRLAARFMHQNFFEFVPQFKIMIAGNHRPRLSSVDEAIRRRMQLIPWAVTIPESERDPRLTEKLKAEWPQILGWAVAGCVEWQHSGLKPPAAVADATDDYLHSEDKLGLWLEERCVMGRQYDKKSSDAFRDYKDWCRERDGGKVWQSAVFLAGLDVKAGNCRQPRELRNHSHLGRRRLQPDAKSPAEYTCGWRSGEIKGMRVRQVDLLRKEIRLESTQSKNGEARTAPLTQKAFLLLSELAKGKQPEDFLFTREDGAPVKDFRVVWANACKHAGCPDLLFHDLRRTAARNLRRAGVAEGVIMEIAGWKTNSIFRRYAIVDGEDKRSAMAALESAESARSEQIRHNSDAAEAKTENVRLQ